jgi:hypothetical protein
MLCIQLLVNGDWLSAAGDRLSDSITDNESPTTNHE